MLLSMKFGIVILAISLVATFGFMVFNGPRYGFIVFFFDVLILERQKRPTNPWANKTKSMQKMSVPPRVKLFSLTTS